MIRLIRSRECPNDRRARATFFRICLVLSSLIFAAGRLAPARAFPGEITWEPEEEIAQAVTEPSTPASPTAVYQAGVWHVVYAAGGSVWFITHDGSSWSPAVRLNGDPALAKDPHTVWVDDGLLVVWEDGRSGHPEIWCRRAAGGAWGEEASLTEDASPSRRPALAATSTRAFLIWEEGPAGARTIQGWAWVDEAWLSLEEPFSGPGERMEPSASYQPSSCSRREGRSPRSCDR